MYWIVSSVVGVDHSAPFVCPLCVGFLWLSQTLILSPRFLLVCHCSLSGSVVGACVSMCIVIVFNQDLL